MGKVCASAAAHFLGPPQPASGPLEATRANKGLRVSPQVLQRKNRYAVWHVFPSASMLRRSPMRQANRRLPTPRSTRKRIGKSLHMQESSVCLVHLGPCFCESAHSTKGTDGFCPDTLWSVRLEARRASSPGRAVTPSDAVGTSARGADAGLPCRFSLCLMNQVGNHRLLHARNMTKQKPKRPQDGRISG